LIAADSALTNFIDRRLNYISKRTAELTTELNNAKDSYSKNKLDINKYAVLIGIPLFIVAALLMYVYGIRTSRKLRDELNAQNNFNSGDYKTGLSFTLYTITALILILSLLILGLAKVIGDNTLAALLGTIAGYLLNNATDRSAPTNTNLPPNPPGPSNTVKQ
jgi:drug/metabolite transporter (DMT)-like permease